MSLANEEYHVDLQNLESKRSQQLIERFEQTVSGWPYIQPKKVLIIP